MIDGREAEPDTAFAFSVTMNGTVDHFLWSGRPGAKHAAAVSTDARAAFVRAPTAAAPCGEHIEGSYLRWHDRPVTTASVAPTASSSA
jgi:hypothetical protein